MTPLLPDEVAFIQSKLSPQSAQLRHKYPNAIWNAADCWDDPTLPANYLPNRIYIYYGDNADTPHIHFENGEVQYINLPADIGQSQVIQVWIDGNCKYVEVEGQIILHKLGDMQLPQPKVTATTIANSLRH